MKSVLSAKVLKIFFRKYVLFKYTYLSRFKWLLTVHQKKILTTNQRIKNYYKLFLLFVEYILHIKYYNDWIAVVNRWILILKLLLSFLLSSYSTALHNLFRLIISRAQWIISNFLKTFFWSIAYIFPKFWLRCIVKVL